ncbi:DUF397 domain-containing protein [Streptomyces sp. ISL-96]|uniref:DUF397 domain-containing protein n=1 Tax=Streptomyces sp. ISL-96 TaxID=2819191 RepID=UPI001BE5F4B5|nr:DUF397 domain-containing protein [Streptomyces sp. ISL-96]MBT2487547.1 DUF397 domain-containing protein [Streptomyces sp. ISL-96]
MTCAAHLDRSDGPVWFKSSYSGDTGGNCVEVAAEPHAVRVRDSKVTDGPVLTVSPTAWTAWTAFLGATA